MERACPAFLTCTLIMHRYTAPAPTVYKQYRFFKAHKLTCVLSQEDVVSEQSCPQRLLPSPPVVSDLPLYLWISGRRFSFCSDASFPHVSTSDHQIIFKFRTHTLRASLRISTPERGFCRDNTRCTGVSQLFWPCLKPVGLFYFQRGIAWTFVVEGQYLCIKTEHWFSQKILMYDQPWGFSILLGMKSLKRQHRPTYIIQM